MKNVLAIFGGDSTEHDISIITAIEAMNACPYRDYKIYPAYILGGVWYSGEKLNDLSVFADFNPKKHSEITLVGKDLYVKKKFKFKRVCRVDCALLLTHGGGVEGGELQGYLETLGIPYTSTDTLTSALCMDKYFLKLALKDAGINVVDGVTVTECTSEILENLEETIGYPMFIKPNSQGSSIGVGVAKNRDELNERILVALNYDKKILVEKCIEDFSEYNCAAMGIGESTRVSEVEKPITAGEFLSFENKYLENVKTACLCSREFPAKISEALRAEIQNTTLKIYTLLGLKGVVRCDYIFKDKLYLNEVNTIPGSLAHYLFEGLTYTELLTLLIDEAVSTGTKQRASFASQVLNLGSPKSGALN